MRCACERARVGAFMRVLSALPTSSVRRREKETEKERYICIHICIYRRAAKGGER